MPTLPRLRPPRRHVWDRRRVVELPDVPPPPPVVSVLVARGGANRFTWIFSQPYDDSGSGGWHASDFAELTIDGTIPDDIDEVIGVDGTLTLIYPFDSAPSVHILGKPAVLIFDNGAQILTPDSGPVLP